MDPIGLFEAFSQRMVQLGGTNSNIVPAQPPHGSKILERFRALRLEKFDGMDEPSKTKQWLREMDLIFDTIECSDQEKRRMATFQLTYATADWWESERATRGEEAIRGITWVTFKVKFLEKYFPIAERNDKRKEFSGADSREHDG